jgi:DNA-binding GntR family transcriptional regulator
VARPKSSDAVYLKIAAALRDRIREGDLKPGDKLPSEAAVSEEFGVARGTAREALKRLEVDGLVDTLPAVGRIVRSKDKADKTPRYRRIAAELIAAIDAGEYPRGTRLPGEAQLAERFQRRGTPSVLPWVSSTVEVSSRSSTVRAESSVLLDQMREAAHVS